MPPRPNKCNFDYYTRNIKRKSENANAIDGEKSLKIKAKNSTSSAKRESQFSHESDVKNSSNDKSPMKTEHKTLQTEDPKLGSEPTNILCPSCNKVITTRIVYQTADRVHLISTLLIVV